MATWSSGATLEECAFAQGGARCATIIRASGGYTVTVDGVRQPPVDSAGYLRFSPDGTRIAYASKHGNDFFAVLDGHPGRAETGIRHLTFSPDGHHFAYAGTQGGSGVPTGARVVVDGVPGPAFESVGAIAWSPDGSHVAYQAMLGLRRQAMVIDHQPGPEYFSVSYERPVFSSGGSQVIYSAADGSRHAFTLQGTKRGPAFETVMYVRLSPAGKHLAYVGGHPPKVESHLPEHATLIDDVPGPTFELVGPCVFSGDGEHFAYAATRGKKYVLVVDHHVQPEEFSWIDDHSLVFGPDGSTIAFIARNEANKFLVCAGSFRSDVFDQVYGPLNFSKDGSSLELGARIGHELWWRVERLKHPNDTRER